MFSSTAAVLPFRNTLLRHRPTTTATTPAKTLRIPSRHTLSSHTSTRYTQCRCSTPSSPRRYSSQAPGGNTTTTTTTTTSANTSTGPSASLPTTPKTESAIPVPNTVGPLPFWQRLGPLTSLARAYSRAQKRRPWVTQFCTALVIYATADLSAQYINSGGADVGPNLETDPDPELHPDAAEKQKQSRGFVPDPSRTARSLVIGGIAAIPSYLW